MSERSERNDIKMKTVLEDYDIFPKVLCTESEASITIRALGVHTEFDEHASYRVKIIPMNHTLIDFPNQKYDVEDAEWCGKDLIFRYHFLYEQQYVVLLEKKKKEKWENCCELRVYALEPDFFKLRPYRGDMHCHTCRSDGREGPEIVAANYRKNGFDFLAITDHGQYEPSQEAIKAYADLHMSFCLFAGEEVHPPQNNCHTVHFGGDFSVNEWIRENPERYEQEVDMLEQKLNIPEGLNKREYASLVWVYQKIREAGGMAIMAHPCWIQDEAYHVRRDMYRYLLKTHPFDALELTCGQSLEENQLQISLWQQMREENTIVPIVGSSDSHGTVNSQWFGLSKMIVLSEACTKDAIIESVKKRCAVVLEQYHGESLPRLYGENRALEFVLFLVTEYMPIHDELCFEEGRLMKEYACGDEDSGDMLQKIGMRTEQLFEKYWSTI